MAGAVWANKVVGHEELAKGRVVLNRLADGNATVNHRLVVREVEHEQVALVSQDARNGQCAFFTYTAVSQMEVCQE